MIQLLKTYIELGHLSMHNVQTMNIHQGIRHIDCLHKFFKAVIYRYKKQ